MVGPWKNRRLMQIDFIKKQLSSTIIVKIIIKKAQKKPKKSSDRGSNTGLQDRCIFAISHSTAELPLLIDGNNVHRNN